MKRFIIPIIIIYFSISAIANDSLLDNKADLNEIMKIDMNSTKDKMNYLLHKLSIGKKYYYKDHKVFFNYVIIGSWSSPPHVAYLFKKNNEYLMSTPYAKNKIGAWKITENGLELYINGKINILKILYFHTDKDREENRYYFSILFDDPRFLLTIDTDLAIIWEKDPMFH